MASWQIRDAKARFDEFLQAAIKEGPQIVTLCGAEAAVLLPIEEWRRLQKAARPDLKELLLSPEPRFEGLTPKRRNLRRRPSVELSDFKTRTSAE